ncbi:MAG: hypothetical protein R2867_45710 [Caldilineaceae bacterium]
MSASKNAGIAAAPRIKSLLFGDRNALVSKPLTINHAFSWESPLSGVCRPDYKEAAWYEQFACPQSGKG